MSGGNPRHARSRLLGAPRRGRSASARSAEDPVLPERHDPRGAGSASRRSTRWPAARCSARSSRWSRGRCSPEPSPAQALALLDQARLLGARHAGRGSGAAPLAWRSPPRSATRPLPHAVRAVCPPLSALALCQPVRRRIRGRRRRAARHDRPDSAVEHRHRADGSRAADGHLPAHRAPRRDRRPHRPRRLRRDARPKPSTRTRAPNSTPACRRSRQAMWARLSKSCRASIATACRTMTASC